MIKIQARIIEDAGEGIVILCGDGIELVIVTTGAGSSQPEEGP